MDYNQATALELNELTKALDTNIWTGLSQAEAQSRLEQYGMNRLVEGRSESSGLGSSLLNELGRFSRQLLNPLIQLLVLAAIVCAAIGESTESISILVAITTICIITHAHVRQIDKHLEELARRMPATCKVQRDGLAREIDTELLVPGDVVHLVDDERAPADLRPIEKLVSLNESTTSETSKNLVLLYNVVDASCYLRGLVVSTGRSTRYGRALAQFRGGLPPAEIERASLHLVVWSCLVIGGISILGIVQQRESSEIFKYALALTVVALPEGLPAVVAAALADLCRQLVDSDPFDLIDHLDRLVDGIPSSFHHKIGIFMTYQVSISLVAMTLIVVAFGVDEESPLSLAQMIVIVNLLADELPAIVVATIGCSW